MLNFGDDYRNFLDSLSESHSSLGGHLLDDRRKRSKRLSKKKLVSVLDAAACWLDTESNTDL